ncbi:flavodoxin family protein [Thermovorax subterraneus]|nr:flavodoxin family protein [Thermovorax subterraneus]
MKVIGIIGSPREGGNTEILVERVLKGASDKGAEVKTFKLNELNIRGCQGCNYCKQNDGCIQKDDMQKIYNELFSADAVVIGSPIYISYVTAQTKIFLDRLYAFLVVGKGSKLPVGKKCVLVYTQGGGDDGKKVMEGIAAFLKRALGMDVKAIIGGNNLNPLGAVNEREDLLQTAYEAGELLVR